jgi:indole-3-glycerol phosphate synthase
MSKTILQRIVETKCAEVERARHARTLDPIRAEAAAASPPRDFYHAVAPVAQPPSAVNATGPDIRLIAEIKKSSPSAGLIRADFDPAAIARVYAAHGAAALSVLTDRTYFLGDLSFIAAVKGAVELPVLRKDFIVDEFQVYESRAAGADAVLLIAAILTPPQIESYCGLAAELGMASLIEVHDADEALAVIPILAAQQRAILAINNRNLATQQIDLKTTPLVARTLPPGMPCVAESGLRTREDIQAMQQAGACAVLIGETFMRAADIGAKVRELMGPQ